MGKKKQLTRSRDDRMIAGVLGGLAQYLGFNSTTLRIGYVILSLIPGITFLTVVSYIVMIAIVPITGMETSNYQRVKKVVKNQTQSQNGRKVLHEVEEEDVDKGHR